MPPATKTPVKPAVATPERSLTQRMEALQRANEIRTRRAQLKRDLKAGRVSIHDLLLEPPDYVETAKVFDMLLAVPEVRPGEGQQGARAVPHLPEQDHRRAVAAPAHRARQHAPPLASRLGPGLRHHRPLRRRQGHADPHAARAACPSWSCRSRRRRAGRAPGETQGVDYHFLSDDEFERRVAGRRLRRARALLRQPLRDAALRARAAARAAGIPSCSRSRSRARARSAHDARGGADLHRPAARRRCARGSSAAAPTTPSRSRRGSRPRARSCARRGSSGTWSINDRLEDAVRGARGMRPRLSRRWLSRAVTRGTLERGRYSWGQLARSPDEGTS